MNLCTASLVWLRKMFLTKKHNFLSRFVKNNYSLLCLMESSICGRHRIRICSVGKYPRLNSLHLPRELYPVHAAWLSTAIAVHAVALTALSLTDETCGPVHPGEPRWAASAGCSGQGFRHRLPCFARWSAQTASARPLRGSPWIVRGWW